MRNQGKTKSMVERLLKASKEAPQKAGYKIYITRGIAEQIQSVIGCLPYNFEIIEELKMESGAKFKFSSGDRFKSMFVDGDRKDIEFKSFFKLPVD